MPILPTFYITYCILQDRFCQYINAEILDKIYRKRYNASLALIQLKMENEFNYNLEPTSKPIGYTNWQQELKTLDHEYWAIIDEANLESTKVKIENSPACHSRLVFDSTQTLSAVERDLESRKNPEITLSTDQMFCDLEKVLTDNQINRYKKLIN